MKKGKPEFLPENFVTRMKAERRGHAVECTTPVEFRLRVTRATPFEFRLRVTCSTPVEFRL
jgi:hypothetical protein